jgi:hypothetical protein
MGRGSYERTEKVRKKQRKAMLQRKQQGLQPRGWKWSDESKLKASTAQKKRLKNPEANPFYGKHHSEISKTKISKARTGLDLTPVERKLRKKQHTTEWVASHPEQIKVYDQRALKPRALANRKRRRELRHNVIVQFGGKCASSGCRWLNQDDSLGCADERLLQLDHVNGGGTKERNSMGWEAMWKKAQQDISGAYQILCSNCNWLKAHKDGAFGIKYGEE